MKGTSLALFSLLLAAPLSGNASEQLIPAGSLIQCTVSEPKLSSKTVAIGDPILCQMGHSERYGRSVLPYNSYLVGRFEDYKDPGHFVGKGWMELKFDRMVLASNKVIPVDAKVVAVPGYNVDRDGRILGKGHMTRDVVMWSIPILWPADILMAPMRGPRPTLKEETRLTLKIMDDLGVPDTDQPQRDPYGLMQRKPTAEVTPPPPPNEDQPPNPDTADSAPSAPPQPPADAYSAPTQAPVYANPTPPPAPVYAYPTPPPAPVYAYAGPPAIYAYGGGMAVRGYAQRAAVRPYGEPVPRGYRTVPRAYGYSGVQHGYGYGLAPRAYSYGGTARGYGNRPPTARMAPGRGPGMGQMGRFR